MFPSPCCYSCWSKFQPLCLADIQENLWKFKIHEDLKLKPIMFLLCYTATTLNGEERWGKQYIYVSSYILRCSYFLLFVFQSFLSPKKLCETAMMIPKRTLDETLDTFNWNSWQLPVDSSKWHLCQYEWKRTKLHVLEKLTYGVDNDLT